MRKSISSACLGMLLASGVLADDSDRLYKEDQEGLELALRAARVEESLVQLDPTEARLLRRTERSLRRGNMKRALGQWSRVIESRALSGAPVDINAIVQWVIRESYLSSNEDLRFHAEKVRYFNEQKKKIRSAAAAARDCRWQRCLSDDVVMAQIEMWEQVLSSIGEDAQLANIDLQNALQRQQQTLQTISNVSKLLHETAQSVIRKIGG